MSPVEKLQAFSQAFKLKWRQDMVLKSCRFQGCIAGLTERLAAALGEAAQHGWAGECAAHEVSEVDTCHTYDKYDNYDTGMTQV